MDLPEIISASLSEFPTTVVDVGASGGIDLLFRRIPNAHFFGFEPNPDLFSKLVSDANTQYLCMALSDRIGTASLSLQGGMSSLEITSDHSIDVQLETLDNLVASGTLPQPDALKVDAEFHDLAVLRGAGRALDETVLTIKSEIGFASKGNCFAEIDAYIRPKGFILFGIQYNTGLVGELGFGDVIYLRSIESILENKIRAREMALKLISMCYMVRNLDYAFVVANEAHSSGALTAEECDAVCKAAARWSYLPNALRVRAHRLAHFLFMLSQIASGEDFRDKSMPKANRLDSYRYLLFRFPGTRSAKRLEAIHNLYKEQRHLYKTAGSCSPASGDE